jgi:hypothetical protein
MMKASSFIKSPYTFVPLGYDVLALLSGVTYIHSGENLAGVYSTVQHDV